MKHFLIDTNVVIDFLIDRRPFSMDAAKLFDLSERSQVRLYLTAVSYNNIYYIVKKHSTHSSTIRTMRQLESMTETIETNVGVIRDALNSEFKDFEDAVQYYSAATVKKIDSIVTRNVSDFKHSKISVLTPDEALILIQSTTR